jgi:3-hydroxyacyl-[acyl-carrier-protein] dehydratase
MEPIEPSRCGLPHREPFVFVDAVVALDPGKAAVCTKRFAAAEPFFRGHFPGNPLVPGVILAEGAAQTAGIAAGEPGRVYYLSAIRQMKFLRPVRPESVVEFTARKTGGIGGMAQFEVCARVGGEVVAEGVIVLSAVEAAADT